MASYRNEWVFLIGGYSRQRHRIEGGVEAYGMRQKRWLSNLPELNEARRNASSCVLNDCLLYTFSGINSMYSTETMVSSIERIKVQALVNRSACLD